ncbi:MAG: SAM-dependent methyltransferase [Bacteroidetes bacterium]|nr:MAG: SAM-dependent methyltransferase [Bacteroidota bacterium]
MIETNHLTSDYWENRYQESKTGWDIGYANKIHTDYVEANYGKDARILIPGAGSAYEAEYLWKRGYTNVHPCDFAPEAKERFLKRVSDFPDNQFITGDFFEITDRFDLVLEQTFFCAINPNLRKSYVSHMHDILNVDGKIYGVMFDMDKPDGPPYGGNPVEYKTLFSNYFAILTMEKSQKSIPKRMGNELIVEFLKK